MLRSLAAVVVVVVVGLVATAHADSDSDRASRMFDRGRVNAADGNYEDACKLFQRSYELEPALGTLLNLADCREHLGDLTGARQLYSQVLQQAMHDGDPTREKVARERLDRLDRDVPQAPQTTTATSALAAPAAQPHAAADASRSRKVWLGMLIGGAAAGAAGIGMSYVAASRLHDIKIALCQGGAYRNGVENTVDGIDCRTQDPTLTGMEIERWNTRGDHARMLAYAGLLTGSVGIGLALVSSYMVFVREAPSDGPTVVPTVSSDYGGATFTMPW